MTIEPGDAADAAPEVSANGPASAGESVPSTEAAPALWNPDACGLWSLLLSPVFGSILLLYNWKSIGDPDKVKQGGYWLAISLVALPLYWFIPFLGLVYIVVWYFAWQKPQTRYVKATWGKDYPRKRWGKPVLIGILAMVAFQTIIALSMTAVLTVTQNP